MAQQPEKPIKITAQYRAHPALRRLARACIALARQQLKLVKPEAKPTEASAPKGGADA